VAFTGILEEAMGNILHIFVIFAVIGFAVVMFEKVMGGIMTPLKRRTGI
jgi:hypothetical protein